MMEVVGKYINASSFEEVVNRYSELPAISFDYEVVDH